MLTPMVKSHALARALITAICLSVLAYGCGGGGGGGSGGGGGGSSNGTLSVSTTSVSLVAMQNGPLPSGQDVVLTVNRNPPYVAGVAYLPGVPFASWLDVQAINSSNPFTFRFSVNNTSLAPGNYSTTLGIGIADLNGTIIDYRTVSVSYTVSSTPVVLVTPTAVHLFASSGRTTTQDVTIDSPGGSAAWTSSISYAGGTTGWLSLTPSSGATVPASITLNTLGVPSGTYKANIVFNVGGAAHTVPVTFLVKVPQVTYVAPYVATSGVAGEVIIRGYGFSTLTGHQVRFGTTMANSVNVLSDTEIRASYPALTANSYAVEVGNGISWLSTRAQLVVTDAPSFTYAAISRPIGGTVYGLKSNNIIYDAERRAIYVCDADLSNGIYVDRLERYRFNGATWTTDPVIAFNDLAHNLNSTIALSPNGNEILKGNNAAMIHVDPANWTVAATVPVPSDLGMGTTLNLMDVSNDGAVIGNASPQMSGGIFYRYEIFDRTFAVLGMPPGLEQPMNRQVHASGNGSRLLVPFFDYSVVGKPLYYYDASTFRFSEAPVSTSFTNRISMDTTGSKVVIQDPPNVHTVYDAAFNSLGTLPALDAVVLSPDGTTAYTYVSGSNTVRAYDLTSPTFGELGSTALADSPGSGIAMTITPDGGTLILAGSQRVVIVPAP